MKIKSSLPFSMPLFTLPSKIPFKKHFKILSLRRGSTFFMCLMDWFCDKLLLSPCRFRSVTQVLLNCRVLYIYPPPLNTWQVIVKIIVFFTIWQMSRAKYILICFTHLNRRDNYSCIFPVFCYCFFHGEKKKNVCVCLWCNHPQALQNTASCPICIISMFCVCKQLRTLGSNLGFFQGLFEGLLIVRNSGNKHKYFHNV